MAVQCAQSHSEFVIDVFSPDSSWRDADELMNDERWAGERWGENAQMKERSARAEMKFAARKINAGYRAVRFTVDNASFALQLSPFFNIIFIIGYIF